VELVDYVRVLRRRWLLIAIAIVGCAGVAYLLSDQRTRVYATTTRLVVSAPSEGGLVNELTSRALSVSRAEAYASYATTSPAVDAALEEAGYTGGGRPAVGGSADGVTPFLVISVSDSDPVKAAGVANAYAETLLEVVARLDGSTEQSGATLAVIDAAGVPAEPTSPRPRRDAELGAVLGLVLGIGSAFVREALDRTYSDPDDLEEDSRLSVLGVIPQELDRAALPTVTHPTSARAEAYRTVRTNLQFAGPPESLKRLVITSATPGEGKTSVAANVSVALSQAGLSVVLIDADLRRPRVASTFDLHHEGPGLAGVLADGTPPHDAIHLVEEGSLALLPAGRLIANPSELLGSDRMTRLLVELEASFDIVVIDTPPVLPVTDALVLAVNATGVVVVVRLGTTARERFRRAVSSLRKLDVPLLGVVANGSVPSGDAAYGYGARYGYTSRKTRGGRYSVERSGRRKT